MKYLYISMFVLLFILSVIFDKNIGSLNDKYERMNKDIKECYRMIEEIDG